MEQRLDSSRSGLTPRTQAAGLLVLLCVVALAFSVSRILSSSFKVELFGEEVLRVERLDREAPAPAGLSSRDEVFVVVEQMPELVGGLEAIQRGLRYPEIAKKAGIEGRVIVRFIVDERGRVTAPGIVRGIGGGCDEEALRVVREARFEPGRQRGRTVKVKMSLPIMFSLG